MTFNRTQADVDTAISILNRMKQGESITEDEKTMLERGTLTINTLNRIENKQYELMQVLHSLGYWNCTVITKEWSYSDYFYGAEFDRILENLSKLKDAFYVLSTTPSIPDNNYRKYQVINDVEHILNDIEAETEAVKGYFTECGTVECGEV